MIAMTPRADIYTVSPEIFKAWYAFSMQVGDSGIEKSLLELVKIRASQINGCANCLNMHTADARKAGETEQRIHLLAAWHEARSEERRVGKERVRTCSSRGPPYQ